MENDTGSAPAAEETGSGQPSTGEAWQEVGRQFQTLGESLAAAFRAAWESPETRRQVETMQDGLESMVSNISDAINQTARAPESQELRDQVKKTADTARQAGEKAFHEAQPHLVAALCQINDELQKFIDHMDEEGEADQAQPAGAGGDQEAG